jgi:hypothetical protein
MPRQKLSTRGAEGNAHVGSPHIALPPQFVFDQVDPVYIPTIPPVPPPPLGPLAAFKHAWKGTGFNTIFRPQSTQTPTKLPVPVPGDNILELNLTRESLVFSPSLGSVPNRGMVQGDIFLNGIPYLQTVSDVTTGQAVGIHVEPGLWMAVPPTTDPDEPTQTFARMASIPHGTTICAQGTASTTPGAPTIPPVDITPFFSSSGQRIRFQSQTASAQDTARLPQDLTGIAITQAMLDDPNSVLRSHLAGQTITSTDTIFVSTSPHPPLFGGGTDNIAFLLGFPGATSTPNIPGQNAQAVIMNATFWIETIEHTFLIGPLAKPLSATDAPLELHPENAAPGAPVPAFFARPEVSIPKQVQITFRTRQIQYSQLVILNFNGLSWPHVSVATLVRAAPIWITGGWPT